ncbi:peptide chain release factor N(5)-glutamine methyltransferase [Paenibacillus alkalitolerans]|uniref:peptide chain release factor N(5)-glutamine methyltransferase n=1 Tax=Paenibacillus alkalitolerans TaxID=2799335 RepID=UPI0018F56497|nr:peptide chain release factor N(5)-glutamine methyltransferase [Paenibacillus alkalitolerans]
MTVREAYIKASSFLRERGVGEHAASAELLMRHVLGVTRTRLLLLWSDPMDAEAFKRLWVLLQRRAAGEPVQYIVGETYFYGLPFAVTPAVLIPRPETELLVERIVALGRELWPPDCGVSPLAVDIGTGSGAIAVSLASECPSWRVAAVDISPAALEVAGGNCVRNGVAGRIALLEGDLFEPAVREYGADGIDILVSNPPYIPSRDLAGLQVEVREYEPHLALDGGADGLVPYRRMLEQMERFGVWPRLVGFEVGMGQARDLERMLAETGRWEETLIVEDLAGIERHVLALRRVKG